MFDSREPYGSSSAPFDSDSDGLLDSIESSGWLTGRGSAFRTDPDLADSDGDGLSDGVEAGPVIRWEPISNSAAVQGVTEQRTRPIFVGLSDPLSVDGDDDGLDDVGEMDEGLDPFESDSDADGLADGLEVDLVGTSPSIADTDHDGFADGYEEVHREDQGLDPLLADVKTNQSSYATDFAIGAVAGDAWRRDSMAWLAGNLTSSGSSSLPVIGWVIGPLADLRDLVASSIRRDWVGSGFSAVGLVPVAGDALEIPAKVASFVARNPQLAVRVAVNVAALRGAPDRIKTEALFGIFKSAPALVADGAYTERALQRLASGGTNLDQLAAAMQRPSHIPGATAQFFPDGSTGERWLTNLLPGSRTQVVLRTEGCVDVCNPSNVRRLDNVIDGVAHEAKVGFKYLTPEMERQIRSDAYLIETGALEGAHWHFLASAHTSKIGADDRVFDLLEEVSIQFTIHPPA